MEKNQLIKWDGIIYRILAVEEENVLLIDCIKKTMPKWYGLDEISEYEVCPEGELGKETGREEERDLKPREKSMAHQRFTVVAGILPFLDDDKMRATVIRKVAGMHGISVQTVRKYLCQYLVYQSISALIPKERAVPERGLTKDEKNFRWALNKFYFTRHKNSLKTAYTYMLKEKYCDGEGKLTPEYPTYNQFRYFYSKYKTMQNALISRNGIKDYQRNHRPLLGDGVQEFAQNVGVGMVDATICAYHIN